MTFSMVASLTNLTSSRTSKLKSGPDFPRARDTIKSWQKIKLWNIIWADICMKKNSLIQIHRYIFIQKKYNLLLYGTEGLDKFLGSTYYY